jgi:CheY-like chemotaxis protein
LVESIESSAARGANLVKQVLAFARGIEGTRVPVRVGDLIREVHQICSNTFPKNIDIRIHAARDLWLILGDQTQINQVLVNLCVNARDAMPTGGKLEITAKNIEIDAQYSVMNRGAKAGKYAMIEISDTGIGIPKAIIDRIFEPFFTTKEIGKGTGLGLSTVAGIVQSHGGFINVYSEVNLGTVFKIYFPAKLDDAADVASPAVDEKLPRGNGELVMIVDDEPTILDVSRQTLEAFGYKVVTADDGAHAIGIYATRRNDVALILTDMMMPVMDGLTLIAALRRINPNVRVVAASGIAGEGYATRAAAAGVRHFIAKPYTADVMLNVIKKALNDEVVGSGHSRSLFPSG